MRKTAALTALFALLPLVAGCARSPRVAFYTLTPPAAEVHAQPGAQAVSVAVGPVSVPDLVDRPQLVVRVAPNRVDILEFHRWAEPLKGGITRVVADALGRRLGSERVRAYGDATASDARYRVLIDITRLDAVTGDSVFLEASWSVRDANGTKRGGHAVVREKTGAGYDAVADGLSRALDTLSAGIAETVRAEAAAAP